MCLDFVNARILNGQIDHGVLQNSILNARLAQLIAQIGHFRDVQAAVVDQHDRFRALKLLFDLRDNRLFCF